MTVSTYLSIITLHVSGLNSPNKRQRMANWLEKQHIYTLPTRDSLQMSKHNETKFIDIENITVVARGLRIG